MYRFALRPKWILGHLVVAALVAGLVSLGFWQLRRLDERRHLNAEVLAGSRSAPVDAVPGRGGEDPAELVHRRFRVSGTFDATREVLVRGRIGGGLPGFEVLTPLVVGDGEAVLVNRGYVPQQLGERWPVPEAAPPAGEVSVIGVALPTERGALRAGEGGVGVVAVVSAVRLPDLEKRLPYRLAPVWLSAESGGSTGEAPSPLPPPDLSEGAHFSYAVQWFLFATIAAGGWLVLLRQSALKRRISLGHR